MEKKFPVWESEPSAPTNMGRERFQRRSMGPWSTATAWSTAPRSTRMKRRSDRRFKGSLQSRQWRERSCLSLQRCGTICTGKERWKLPAGRAYRICSLSSLICTSCIGLFPIIMRRGVTEIPEIRTQSLFPWRNLWLPGDSVRRWWRKSWCAISAWVIWRSPSWRRCWTSCAFPRRPARSSCTPASSSRSCSTTWTPTISSP